MSQPIFHLSDPTQYNGVAFSPAISTDPGTIQNALIARLKAMQGTIIPRNLEIAAFPDDPESWRAVNETGTILVRWEGFEAGDIENTELVVQPVKHRFKVGILARGLGWSDAAGTSPTGGYAIVWATIGALLGYKVPGCQETYAEKAEFVRRDRQGGIWIYAVDFIVATVLIQARQPESWPTFTQGIVNDSVGESTDSASTEGAP